ncbi:33231_t:CDS:1, partial [Racocetra persica]
MTNGNQEKKGSTQVGEGSNNKKVDKETREGQIALMFLKNDYAQVLELMNGVWKLDLLTAYLSILCIIIGYALLLLKEYVEALNSIVSLVPASSFLISGGGVIAAFKSLVTSSPDSDIEKGGEDYLPDVDLAESATLIVESKLIDKVCAMIRRLALRNLELRRLKMFQSLWLFAGCIVIFFIAGYDFLNFLAEKSNGTIVDWVLIIIGIVGLLFCASVSLVLGLAKVRF